VIPGGDLFSARHVESQGREDLLAPPVPMAGPIGQKCEGYSAVNQRTAADDLPSSAVTGLRTAGYLWAEIVARLGVTRQAAQQRFTAPGSCSDCDGGDWQHIK
jgi:hypothetical protein